MSTGIDFAFPPVGAKANMEFAISPVGAKAKSTDVRSSADEVFEDRTEGIG